MILWNTIASKCIMKLFIIKKNYYLCYTELQCAIDLSLPTSQVLIKFLDYLIL